MPDNETNLADAQRAFNAEAQRLRDERREAAYAMGSKARKDHGPAAEHVTQALCPYQRGSRARQAWLFGWFDADAGEP